VVGHDNTVTGIEGVVLSLEEVIRVVEVDALLPSFSCLLVAFEIWVVSDEDP